MLIRSGRWCRDRSQSPQRTPPREDKKRKPEKEYRSEAQKLEHRRRHEEQERKKEEELRRKLESRDRDQDQQKLAKTSDELDEELERNLKILERAVCPMELRAKVMATMWITKLRSTPQSPSDAKARNLIAAHLAKCVKNDVFEFEPFSQPPPPENFMAIKKKLNVSKESTCLLYPRTRAQDRHSSLKQLFSNSYDRGEYMKRLPVPRDGSFFILHMRPNL